MKLLALDTATEACSAALLLDGALHTRLEILGRGHAERLLPMVDELLTEAGLVLGALDAIACGRGPGAFTGVRIAVSVAQGLALGTGLPVVPVSDLAALALQALERAALATRPATQRDVDSGAARDGGPGVARDIEPGMARDAEPGGACDSWAGAALVCLDARMNEVYWSLARRRADRGIELLAESVGAPGSVVLAGDEPLVGAGHGFAAYPQLRARFQARLVGCWPQMLPRAEEIARLALIEVRAGRTLRPEAAQPLYLRNDVATRSGRPVAT